jgi:UDP-N-acetylglucosamine 2-epimerase (non-hydrolysing)
VKLLVVAAARPNFMKVAPLIWEVARRPSVEACLVHTGQHYDERMSKLFFEQLRIPRPSCDLGVGSGSHAAQTAEVMKRIEPVLLDERPDVVVVVGDVNSTVAAALTAVKVGLPVAHVEAGLRSFDRAMPEEVNRIVTDAVSDWLFVSEPSGLANLRREGVDERRVFFVGNIMIDTLVACRDEIAKSTALEDFGVGERAYALVTLHRPSNVDEARTLEPILSALAAVQERIPIIFPVHPRTRKVIERLSLPGAERLRLTEPLGYLDFMRLVSQARFVMTDSGGIQEETTFLGVPCLTLRTTTERPVTIEVGTNRLVSLGRDEIVAAADQAMSAATYRSRVPDLWDGKTADRILDILTREVTARGKAGAN